ncbi:MAG: metallophosphoesterase [Erysipelotrichaceae bacterium]|nr:metallophosphoesterase [Erysipelotrichaceae bacterium]
MIYVTGDLHGEIDVGKLDDFNIPDLTKDDMLIICGDFGFVWDYRGPSGYEKRWLDYLEQKPYTILFVDGNHENFNRLNKEFPIVKWHGGNVHKLREHVIHLMRGQLYLLEGKVFFTMGGASSHDKILRQPQKSWWPQELPNSGEMYTGRRNLEIVNRKVDYIITHCLPTSLQRKVPKFGYDTNRLTDYLDEIYKNVDFSHWYCGHYHMNYKINDKVEILYQRIKKIDGIID